MVPSKPEKVRAAQLRCRTLLAEEEARLPILPISAGLQVRLDWLSVRLDWLSVRTAVPGRRAGALAAPSTMHACLTARLPVPVLREWVLPVQAWYLWDGLQAPLSALRSCPVSDSAADVAPRWGRQ